MHEIKRLKKTTFYSIKSRLTKKRDQLKAIVTNLKSAYDRNMRRRDIPVEIKREFMKNKRKMQNELNQLNHELDTLLDERGETHHVQKTTKLSKTVTRNASGKVIRTRYRKPVVSTKSEKRMCELKHKVTRFLNF
jgi:hypothetical protein